jgi:hypothetical protein
LRRALVLLAAVCLPAVGCTSMNLAQVEVALPARLDDGCLEASLRAEQDVVGLRSMPQGGSRGWFFQLADPDLTYKEMPSFVVSEAMVSEGPTVQIEANFVTDSRHAELREAIARREQEILSRVVAACTDAAVEFGPARECGKGEKDTLCVKGRLRSP